MALSMKPACEKCNTALSEIGEAYICAYECTFCPACAQQMQWTCPNCNGELVRRPKKFQATS